ncbi:MAG: hypothetical protein RSF82_13115 [Angelakisella sp.]
MEQYKEDTLQKKEVFNERLARVIMRLEKERVIYIASPLKTDTMKTA